MEGGGGEGGGGGRKPHPPQLSSRRHAARRGNAADGVMAGHDEGEGEEEDGLNGFDIDDSVLRDETGAAIDRDSILQALLEF